jgi:hypothetical protein
MHSSKQTAKQDHNRMKFSVCNFNALVLPKPMLKYFVGMFMKRSSKVHKRVLKGHALLFSSLSLSLSSSSFSSTKQ